jgi:hypothetical protein
VYRVAVAVGKENKVVPPVVDSVVISLVIY